jgi:hypothetical protein
MGKIENDARLGIYLKTMLDWVLQLKTMLDGSLAVYKILVGAMRLPRSLRVVTDISETTVNDFAYAKYMLPTLHPKKNKHPSTNNAYVLQYSDTRAR